jgi:hypothetical protein
VLVTVPGKSATVLVALACTDGTPTVSSAGKLTKEPPPASAFMAPAVKPAPAAKIIGLINSIKTVDYDNKLI